MTFEEKLKRALEIGNKFMSMDHFCQISFQCWPHDETDGFQHKQTAYEATIRTESGKGTKTFVGKTPEEVLDKIILALKEAASKRAASIRTNIESASRWDEIASSINLD